MQSVTEVTRTLSELSVTNQSSDLYQEDEKDDSSEEIDLDDIDILKENVVDIGTETGELKEDAGNTRVVNNLDEKDGSERSQQKLFTQESGAIPKIRAPKHQEESEDLICKFTGEKRTAQNSVGQPDQSEASLTVGSETEIDKNTTVPKTTGIYGDTEFLGPYTDVTQNKAETEAETEDVLKEFQQQFSTVSVDGGGTEIDKNTTVSKLIYGDTEIPGVYTDITQNKAETEVDGHKEFQQQFSTVSVDGGEQDDNMQFWQEAPQQQEVFLRQHQLQVQCQQDCKLQQKNDHRQHQQRQQQIDLNQQQQLQQSCDPRYLQQCDLLQQQQWDHRQEQQSDHRQEQQSDHRQEQQSNHRQEQQSDHRQEQQSDHRQEQLFQQNSELMKLQQQQRLQQQQDDLMLIRQQKHQKFLQDKKQQEQQQQNYLRQHHHQQSDHRQQQHRQQDDHRQQQQHMQSDHRQQQHCQQSDPRQQQQQHQQNDHRQQQHQQNDHRQQQQYQQNDHRQQQQHQQNDHRQQQTCDTRQQQSAARQHQLQDLIPQQHQQSVARQPQWEQQQHLQTDNLKEDTLHSNHLQSQDTLQPNAQVPESRGDPQIAQGGDGSVNVFGGRLDVDCLSVNLPPESEESAEKQRPAGNFYVFGGNVNIGDVKGIEPPPNFDVFEGDGVIFYSEADSGIAKDFKIHLEQDFLDLGIKVELFPYIDSNKSIYASLETVLYRFRYAFVIITENLKQDRSARRVHEDLQTDCFEEDWKTERIVPIWTSSDKSKCPLEFKSLKGIKYYERNSEYDFIKKFYRDCIRKQVKIVRQNSEKWEKYVKEHKDKHKTED